MLGYSVYGNNNFYIKQVKYNKKTLYFSSFFKFIPRGLPRDKVMVESGVHTPDEIKNLIYLKIKEIR